MALLQFKPAPMYILDEIDAALDRSHMQHIGTLFRTWFRGAQFIVVSLKEGLFTNANVLFRVQFCDGTSVVERTAQRNSSSLYNSSEREREEGTAGGGWRVCDCGYTTEHGEVTRVGRINGILLSVFVSFLYCQPVVEKVVEFRYLPIFL